MEYKPPKKIGESDFVMGSSLKLDFVEDQIVNVLGYVQTLWKGSEFIKPVDKSPTNSNFMQTEEEDQVQRNQNPIMIAQDLEGIDLSIKKTEDLPKKVQPKPPPEEPKIDPKEIKRNQIIDKLMKQIPDYEFLLKKTIFSDKTNT